MAEMNYLALVNRAVKEAKVNLDPLTAANFADPPRTVQYSLFKDWINDAYEELYGDRPEWFFRRERGTVNIRPRLFLGGVSASLAIGDVLVGRTSGVEVQIMELHSFEEAEQNEAAELTVSVEYINGDQPSSLIAGELFDRTIPTAVLGIAQLQGLGYYDFAEILPGLQSVDMDSFALFDVPTATEGSRLYTQRPYTFVTPVAWPSPYEVAPISGTAPRYISETPYGSYALYPQPQEQMIAQFDYSRRLLRMQEYDDVPEALPEEYHLYLVWKAIEEFADYNADASLFRRANKHTTKLRYWMERDELPNLRFETSRFNR